MKLYSLLAVILLSSLSFQSFSQEDTTKSRSLIRYFFPPKIGEHKWKLIAGLDAHRSFYRRGIIKLNGVRLGAQYNGVHRFGIGLHALAKPVTFSDIPIDDPRATDTSVVNFNVNFASVFYERVIYRSKKWEWAIPGEFGLGRIRSSFSDSLGLFVPYKDIPFASLNAGVQVKYYIFPWIAPRLALGYRHSFGHQQAVGKALNRPYFSYGLQILLVELYHSIFNATRLQSIS